MRLGALVILILLAAPGFALALKATSPASQPRTDDELRSHLDELQKKVNDLQVDLTTRERLATEMASTLDRAAQGSTSAGERLAYWDEAVAMLDRFRKENPGHPLDRQFAVQAAVYLWASARTEMPALRANPNDPGARAKAAARLSDSIDRLKPVIESLGEKATDVFAQNARYRIAQARADLAEVDATDDATRKVRNEDALANLSPPFTEPSLLGFSHLLRATLLTRLRQYDQAQKDLDAAAKATPPPPETDLLEARVALFIGTGQFAEIPKAIEAAKMAGTAKRLFLVRALVAERAAVGPGAKRVAAETKLFRELKALRDSGSPDLRAALIATASAFREPDALQPAFAWDLIAEGAVALGDLVRAAKAESKAAEVARTAGNAKENVADTLKAGAFYFQAEKYAEADPLLTRVAEDKDAGPSRSKAGLLRALARGRAVGLKQPGSSQSAYVDALAFQVKTFPDDPATAEARWLLGKIKLAGIDRAEAERLWLAIAPGSPRWLDSRLEIARLHQAEVDAQRLNNDQNAMRAQFEAAQKFLTTSIDQSRVERDTRSLQIALARLELTPGLGHPDLAYKALEKVQHSASLVPQRDAARRLSIVALSQTNRFVESEQLARAETKTADPIDLVETIRLLDRSASETESDLRMRRMGLVLRVLLTRVVDGLQSFSVEDRAEIRLRQVRAFLFSGDEESAKRAIQAWTDPPPSSTEELLRDLAETYSKLGAFHLAEDVQRLRSKRSATGSYPWFDARYGLALAYYRSGKPKDALHLIDATAILHPDLGGGELREKFLKLRQRIDAKD